MVWCAVSSCVGVGAGVQCAFVARVCLCGVWRGLARGEKNRVRPKRLRVFCQNAGTCSTCGRFAGAHGDVLNVHTEGFLTLSVFLFLSSSLLPVSLAPVLPLKSTKQPLSGNFLPQSNIAPQGKNPVPGGAVTCTAHYGRASWLEFDASVLDFYVVGLS